MAVGKDTIVAEITWFNTQIADLNAAFIRWLKEDGHDVQGLERKITKREELSGDYATFEYTLIIDGDIKITLVPYGIWIVAAKGRVDVFGPSGSEKLVYLNKGGPVTVIETTAGSYHDKSVHHNFNNINEDGWYWFDDSGSQKMTILSKEVVNVLLGRLQ